jgi:SH3-like domain-containing protein
VRRDAEYPDWVWCVGPDGREGWVPLERLRMNGDDAVLVADYDARELSVSADEDVVVHEEIGGWARVSNAEGQTGWVRGDCLAGAGRE